MPPCCHLWALCGDTVANTAGSTPAAVPLVCRVSHMHRVGRQGAPRHLPPPRSALPHAGSMRCLPCSFALGLWRATSARNPTRDISIVNTHTSTRPRGRRHRQVAAPTSACGLPWAGNSRTVPKQQGEVLAHTVLLNLLPIPSFTPIRLSMLLLARLFMWGTMVGFCNGCATTPPPVVLILLLKESTLWSNVCLSLASHDHGREPFPALTVLRRPGAAGRLA